MRIFALQRDVMHGQCKGALWWLRHSFTTVSNEQVYTNLPFTARSTR